MDKYEAWKLFGKLSEQEKEDIKNNFKNKLILEGIERPGNRLLANAITEHYVKNNSWEINS